MVAIGHHRLEQRLINMLQMKFISAVKKSECKNQNRGPYLLTGGDQRKTIKLNGSIVCQICTCYLESPKEL